MIPLKLSLVTQSVSDNATHSLSLTGRQPFLFLFSLPFTDDADDGHEALDVDDRAEVVLEKFVVGLPYLAAYFVGRSLLHTAFHLR